MGGTDTNVNTFNINIDTRRWNRYVGTELRDVTIDTSRWNRYVGTELWDVTIDTSMGGTDTNLDTMDTKYGGIVWELPQERNLLSTPERVGQTQTLILSTPNMVG